MSYVPLAKSLAEASGPPEQYPHTSFPWARVAATMASRAATTASSVFPGHPRLLLRSKGPRNTPEMPSVLRISAAQSAPAWVSMRQDHDPVLVRVEVVGVGAPPRGADEGVGHAPHSAVVWVTACGNHARRCLGGADEGHDDTIGAYVQGSLQHLRPVTLDPEQDRPGPSCSRGLQHGRRRLESDGRVLHVDDQEVKAHARHELGHMRAAAHQERAVCGSLRSFGWQLPLHCAGASGVPSGCTPRPLAATGGDASPQVCARARRNHVKGTNWA